MRKMFVPILSTFFKIFLGKGFNITWDQDLVRTDAWPRPVLSDIEDFVHKYLKHLVQTDDANLVRSDAEARIRTAVQDPARTDADARA